MDKLVTIAIASYNNAPYIERCIDSVIQQSYRNLEILIVDDGSKDNTLSIIERYKEDKRVRILSKENGGLSSVRQMGMENAKGEYISFIDADDYLKPFYVESMVKKIVADDSDVCVCSTQFVDTNGIELPQETLSFYCKESERPYLTAASVLGDVKDALWYKLLLSDSWNKLYRMSTIRSTGVSFKIPKGLNGTDYLFNTLLAVHELKYSTIAETGYVHVIYSSSAVHRKNKDIQKTYQIIIHELIEESKKLNSYNNIKRRIIVEYFVSLMSAYDDLYKESNDYKEVLRSFKICRDRHLDYVKTENIETCKVNEMPTKKTKIFLVLHNYLHGLLPLYFLILKRA